jgi:hypothetical protein
MVSSHRGSDTMTDIVEEDEEFKRLDDLIARHLYWQLPIIAKQSREVGERIRGDAKIDPADMLRPTTV